jgi:hypothetical protein
LGSGRSAGLMIGRSHLGFACASTDGAGQRITRIEERKLEVPLFTGRPSDATAAGLAQLLRELAPEAVRSYLPLHVSLPGAAVQMAVFPLDVLPKKHTVQLDLARWHFTQAGNAEQALVCDCESLGMDGDKHLLLGFAMDQAWHACIVDALAQAGMTAWSLNADVCRQFNRFNDRLCQDNPGGALFAVTADAWSLLLWDETGRTRYCSSRWRSGDEGEGTRIAAEVERRILASVQSMPGMRIKHLYAVTDSVDEGLTDAIDARLREPCIRLRPETGELGLPESAAYRFAPVAAALQP